MLEEIESLAPFPFFEIACDVEYLDSLSTSILSKKGYQLPDFSTLHGMESFAKIYLGWNEQGIRIDALIQKPFDESHYPGFRSSDSLELFLDTRPSNNTLFVSKFCHHFVLFPPKIAGVASQEITHFRTDETHPLCDPALLDVHAVYHAKSYELNAVIRSDCLHGYDPAEVPEIGFSYQVNRTGGYPMAFTPSSREIKIETHPNLYVKFNLKKG